ncbi:MAG TPA: YciI family protein [Kofleriaceae bacterium]|nr:YciI family protein [Kofleriaceae bacterium]
MIFHPTLSHATQPPSQELMTKMGAFIEESTRNGTLISTGGTGGVSYGIRVQRANGKTIVSDGPYAEAKELVGGYALCELPSREVAIEYAKRFIEIVGDGESEIHELCY